MLFHVPLQQIWWQLDYNAHHVAYPQIDWEFGGKFVGDTLGHHSFPTTQIEHTTILQFFDALKNQYDCY
jgi:adenylosuccinate lyase